jgi:secreted Zn-dependent insulinase-like peptidase
MPTDQAKAIADINMTDLQQFSSQLLGELDVEILASGNLHPETLDRFIKQLQVLNYKPLTNHYKIAKLQQYDISRSMAIDHEDTVLIQYIQADTDTLAERAVSGLLAQMISAPFYNELRTQQQLGYVVSAFSLPINKVPGICMIAQSPVASEHELKKEFIDFNKRFKQQIDNLSLAELQRHKRALLVDIEKAPDNLSEYNTRHLKSLSLGFYGFDFHSQLASAINAISIADIQLTYHRLVLDKPRRLWVQTQNNPASDTDQANQTVVDKYYMYPY